MSAEPSTTPARKPPRLAVRGLTVRYGDHMALDSVDLEVEAGVVMAVLGPSGSGKSTLLRAVAGLERPDAGTIAIDGSEQRGVPPHRRGVGLMFQDHALFPHRDVAGNVAFGLRMQGRPKAEVDRRVSELLELVELPGWGGRAVGTLSGGEQQRVALARALAPSPRLLLLDEPLGALDRSLRDHLVGELRSLFTRLGLTVVAVTHDQSEAFALADRLALVDDGRVVQEGPPREVWERPRSRRAAELLGFPNLIDGVVTAGQVSSGWGTLQVDRPDGPATVLVRPAAVVLDPAGAQTGTVVASTFQGEITSVVIAVEGAPPIEAHLAGGAAPTVGTGVRWSIRPEGAVGLDR